MAILYRSGVYYFCLHACMFMDLSCYWQLRFGSCSSMGDPIIIYGNIQIKWSSSNKAGSRHNLFRRMAFISVWDLCNMESGKLYAYGLVIPDLLQEF